MQYRGTKRGQNIWHCQIAENGGDFSQLPGYVQLRDLGFPVQGQEEDAIQATRRRHDCMLFDILVIQQSDRGG